MTLVGVSGCARWVEVDVNDVVQRANGSGNGLFELHEIELALVCEVGVEHHGTEVTDRSFILGSVEGDFGA